VTNSHILLWPSATNPCEPPGWPRISCDPSGHVSSLNFPDAGLDGGLPPSFWNLSSLQFVNLINNSVYNLFPSFRGISFLQRALLNKNTLSSLLTSSLGLSTLSRSPLAAMMISILVQDPLARPCLQTLLLRFQRWSHLGSSAPPSSVAY
jgi:hypothetical protein